GDALVLGPAVGSTGRLELARQEDVSRARVRDLEVRARFLAGKDEQAPRPGAVARLGAFRVVDQLLAGDDELQRAGAIEVAGRAARPGRLRDDENRPFGHVAALEVDDGVVLDVGRPREVERARLDAVDEVARLAREVDAVPVSAVGSAARLQHGARLGEQVLLGDLHRSGRDGLEEALVRAPEAGASARREVAGEARLARARVRDREIGAALVARGELDVAGPHAR